MIWIIAASYGWLGDSLILVLLTAISGIVASPHGTEWAKLPGFLVMAWIGTVQTVFPIMVPASLALVALAKHCGRRWPRWGPGPAAMVGALLWLLSKGLAGVCFPESQLVFLSVPLTMVAGAIAGVILNQLVAMLSRPPAR